MRIAYVCADQGVPVFGRKGCSVHVQEMLRALKGFGAKLELFATRRGGEPASDLAAIPCHMLPYASQRSRARREQFALDANEALRDQLALHGPFDVIYERYSLWSFAAMEFARSQGVGGLLEVNSPLVEEQATHRGLFDRAEAEEVARRTFGAATAVVAVSDQVAKYVKTYPSARCPVHVVPNGVNTRRFSPEVPAILPAKPDTFTVGFVGTMKPWHGLSVLIEAFEEHLKCHPNSRLLLVGDGPELESLVETVRSKSDALAPAIRWTGSVPPEQVPGLLRSMDVAVAPYPNQRDFYFSPLKVFEAMAAGLPVVASRIGQLADVIVDEANGLLCPPGDAVELTKALGRLQRDVSLRKRLGRAARETVLETHTWEHVARQVFVIANRDRPAEPVPVGGRD